MSFKIKDGTRPDIRLCDSCRHSQIMKGPGQGQEIILCSVPTEVMVVPFRVVECSDYRKKGALTDYEAERIGWVLEVKGGRVMGFRPPKKDKDE